MKPVRLTMQAFGPYPATETIDFRDAVDAGLFGIYGPTGSGKSTVFSAIAFALFGQAAKSEQEAQTLRSQHAEASVPTEVEFVFDIGADRYVALRQPEQVRPARRGGGETRSPHEAFLFKATGLALDEIRDGRRGEVIREKKVREVDAAICELLGYGADQFRQIVLLPQGRFETFLAAKTSDRKKLLGELFDVSLYRDVAAKLKADAAAAEEDIRQERVICDRRLEDEGFESVDMMESGIVEATAYRQEQTQLESVARTSFDAAQTALQAGKSLDAQFVAAEAAQAEWDRQRQGQAAMNELATRAVQAEKARLLIDPEAQTAVAEGDVGDAEARLEAARDAAGKAELHAGQAVSALEDELAHADEINGLRRQADDLARHQRTLESAAGAREELNAAQTAERDAGKRLKDAGDALARVQTDEAIEAEKLKAARINAGQRDGLQRDLVALGIALAAARAFETATADVAAANRAVAAATSQHDVAARAAKVARDTFEEAERSLSQMQALHLSAKLKSGEACPVCGGTDHPAPATGLVENAGRNQAFEVARTALSAAEKALRGAEGALAESRGVQQAWGQQLAGLEAPARPSQDVQADVTRTKTKLVALGPAVDIAMLEAALHSLQTEIAAARLEREALDRQAGETKTAAASAQARLDQMLDAIPEALRDPAALAEALARARQLLTQRETAKADAEQASSKAREAALMASKDAEAAAERLQSALDKLGAAKQQFADRLAQMELSTDAFRLIKPAIATIDTDRAAVEAYRRKLAIAEEAANSTAEAVTGRARPDLSDLEVRLTGAQEALDDATEQRMRAEHRLDHLTKLHADLSETLRKLEDAEAASAPLRRLAALTNGANPQNLDLETFAIGAMFDQVLAAANLQLGPMTANRYRLEREVEVGGRGRRGLGIQVFDAHTGKARVTATLSGGESFITALALALGLANVVESASGRVRLDTIFIDEGFGTLDTENGAGALDQVLQVLGALTSQNRAVGVVSHVQGVQDAIPNGFYVRKHLTGSSIETRGAS